LSGNNKGYKHLSDIIPEADRTFPINGTIGFVDAADARITTYDIPYDFSKCPPDGRLIKVPDAQLTSISVAE
jgi:hypothetical protein